MVVDHILILIHLIFHRNGRRDFLALKVGIFFFNLSVEVNLVLFFCFSNFIHQKMFEWKRTGSFSDLSLLLSSNFFQNRYIFRAKVTQSIELLRIDSYLGQLLFRRTNLFRIKISIEELLFGSKFYYTVSNSSEQLLFQQIQFFKRRTFSEQLFCQESYSLETDNLSEKQYSATHFFTRVTFTQLQILLINQYTLPSLVTHSDSVGVLLCAAVTAQTSPYRFYLIIYLI